MTEEYQALRGPDDLSLLDGAEFRPAPCWIDGTPEVCQSCESPENCASEHDCRKGLDA